MTQSLQLNGVCVKSLLINRVSPLPLFFFLCNLFFEEIKLSFGVFQHLHPHGVIGHVSLALLFLLTWYLGIETW